jgi:hypothetical protein
MRPHRTGSVRRGLEATDSAAEVVAQRVRSSKLREFTQLLLRALRMPAITYDIWSLGFALAISAAILAVLLSLAMAARMSTFLFGVVVFHCGSPLFSKVFSPLSRMWSFEC